MEWLILIMAVVGLQKIHALENDKKFFCYLTGCDT
tara:strand:- start:3045 stop:3149 length:105 start_codon:yes stop_codon:yes gene_type:complete